MEAGFCSLCQGLIGARDLREALQGLARALVKHLGVKGCTVRLLDAKARTLQIVAAYGLSKEYLKKGPVRLQEHPVDERVLRGEVVSTLDITKEPHVLYLKEAKKEGICSVLSVPLMAEGRAIGVVRVYTSRPHRFSPEEIERVRFLAAIGGAVAERARLLAQMQALLQSAQAMTASLSLKEVLQRLLEGAVKALGAKAASVRLLEPDGQNLQVAAAHGLSQEYLKKGPVLVKKSPLDRECLACKVVNIVDVKRTRKLQYPQEVLKEGIRGLIGVPLVLRGRVIGVLRLYTAVPYKFSPQEVDFLQALACQGAIAIENARLYEHVRREYEELKRDVWRWYDWGERFPQRL